MQHIAILGRQPALGLAELESLFGASAIQRLDAPAALLNIDSDDLNLDNLGGILKIGQVLATLNTSNWQKISSSLENSLPKDQLQNLDGKLKLGISVYGTSISAGKINATALTLKKSLRASGLAKSVRIVPNTAPDLNAAQVIHNKLTAENGIELLVVVSGQKTIVAQTTAVQNIDAYAARDQARPYRDSRVGMLPPKLAQTIINLAIGQNTSAKTILDPFCGTGVVLQEALQMGYSAFGSDLEPRMTEYSQKNLSWLQENAGKKLDFTVLTADATTHAWEQHFDTIACETYLGRALSSKPDPETLRKIISDCNTIHNKFLQNISSQTKAGFRMCIAVPAWANNNRFYHLPVLDHLRELGYNRVSFVHVRDSDLIYHRKDQFVARELVVLERI